MADFNTDDEPVILDDDDAAFNFTYTYNKTTGDGGNNKSSNGSETVTGKSANATANYVLPVVYLVIWGLIVVLFLRWKRGQQRKKAQSQVENSWFGSVESVSHEEFFRMADALDPESSDDARRQLGQALMRRAMVDVQRIWALREEKPALQTLVRQGAIGEEMWDKFTKAEEHMEVEVQAVVEDANWVKAGWGASIFPEASQLLSQISAKESAQSGAQSAPSPIGSPVSPQSLKGPKGQAQSKAQTQPKAQAKAPVAATPRRDSVEKKQKPEENPFEKLSDTEKKKQQEEADRLMEELINEEEKDKRKQQNQIRQRAKQQQQAKKCPWKIECSSEEEMATTSALVPCERLGKDLIRMIVPCVGGFFVRNAACQTCTAGTNTLSTQLGSSTCIPRQAQSKLCLGYFPNVLNTTMYNRTQNLQVPGTSMSYSRNQPTLNPRYTGMTSLGLTQLGGYTATVVP